MKITFYGGAGGVTGSKHLIETETNKILLDCGLFQGHRKEARQLNSNLPFDAKSIDAVVLSHGHLDHCGNLPLLVKQGFEGRIYATEATRDVAAWILRDAAHIQAMDVAYMNRHRIAGAELAEPLFDQTDVDEVIARFIEVSYVRLSQDWFHIAPHIKIKLYDAGHILGSAAIVLEIMNGNQHERLAYTGDLGRVGTPLLPDPEFIRDHVPTLLMESTYGNRIHRPVSEAVDRLQEIVKRVYERNGKIIVPAFALGRTQELVYVLHQLTNQGKIPKIDIFVDSPLATHLTEVFTRHPETYDEEAWADFGKKGDLPLAFKNLTYTESQEESKALNKRPGPFMVISASGMCEAGRILHHLINNVEDERNVILITGFQAQNTLGRRLVEGDKNIRIFGQRYNVKAEVEVLNEFSAHADAPALQHYAEQIKDLKRVFLVHGETSQAEAFKTQLSNQHPQWSVEVPALGNSYQIL
jgi:metallo-beta-lactamase family protein